MALQDMERDMAGCSRCSSCKWIPHNQVKSWRFAQGCPSSTRYSFHAYSGSGKMIMGLSMLQSRSELNDDVAGIIYNCQLCGSCQVSCQVYRDDIDLSDVLLELRAKCVEDGFLILEHMEMLQSMKKEDNPLGMLKADRGRWAEGLGLPEIGGRQVEVLFHAGCRYSYDEDLRGTVRGTVSLLRDAGIDIGVAGKDEACCGGRAYELGYQGEMRNFADDMAGRVKASGARTLVTACSDCYYTFMYLYPKNGLDLGVEVLHITELVGRMIEEGRIEPAGEVPMRVTYHDPCHLGRRGESYKEGWSGGDKLLRPVRFKQSGRLGVFDPPRDIIRALPGIELVEMERIREYSWCCGAGGGVLEAFPEFASWTAGDRLEEAAATGAEALVTACPWCVRVFRDAVTERGMEMKIYDVMELLASSLGGA
ncbi:MAG: (Fe-S)-binding protein [Actinobacteria bacterium]|jgi:Fe-S oxidoreductase|nr:MAG: (Fe-S)-binding protein [Actinomycetota bacterium]